MVDTDGREHDLVKGMVAPFFNRESVEKLSPTIKQIVERAFAEVEHDYAIDVLNDIAFHVSMRAAFLVFGIDEACLDYVRPRLEAIAFFITGGEISVDAAVSARRDIEMFVERQWRARELSGPLGALYNAQESGTIKFKFALHNATLLLVSSISTSVAAICLVFYHLHYKDSQVFRDDNGPIAHWLADLLRRHPPLARISRFRTAKGDESGLSQSESWVNLSLECNQISPSSGRSLSFGIGEHACLGSRLAMCELAFVTKALASRMRPTSTVVHFEEREGSLRIPNRMVYSW